MFSKHITALTLSFVELFYEIQNPLTQDKIWLINQNHIAMTTIRSQPKQFNLRLADLEYTWHDLKVRTKVKSKPTSEPAMSKDDMGSKSNELALGLIVLYLDYEYSVYSWWWVFRSKVKSFSVYLQIYNIAHMFFCMLESSLSCTSITDVHLICGLTGLTKTSK